MTGKVPDCINSGRYTEMAQGLGAATNVNSTPTIRINGEDYSPTTPDALVAKIREIVGDVPGLEAAPPAQAPAPPAQAPAPPAQAPTPAAAPPAQAPAPTP